MVESGLYPHLCCGCPEKGTLRHSLLPSSSPLREYLQPGQQLATAVTNNRDLTQSWNVIKTILKSPSRTTHARSARQPHCRFVLLSFSPHAQQQYSNMSIHHCIGLVCHSHCPSMKTWSVTMSRPTMSHPSSSNDLNKTAPLISSYTDCTRSLSLWCRLLSFCGSLA
jgi:hypothetical protein